MEEKDKDKERQSERKQEQKLGKLDREQVPCWQRGGSQSSAAEHFDKSCSRGRTWTGAVFRRDAQDVI